MAKDLPDPNGYDAVCGLAASLGLSHGESRIEPSELIHQLRPALSIPSSVPVRFGQEWLQSDMTNLIVLKALARVLDLEFQAKLGQRDFTNAMAHVLDLFRLSEVSSKGGLMIHVLVGFATESMATRSAEKLEPHLAASDHQVLLAAIADFKDRRESVETVLERDRTWSKLSDGLWIRLARRIGSGSLQPALASELQFSQTYSNQVNRLDFLIRLLREPGR